MEPRKATGRKAKEGQQAATPNSLAGHIGDAPSAVKKPMFQMKHQTADEDPNSRPAASGADGQAVIQEPGIAQELVVEGNAERDKVKAKRRKTSALPWESTHGWRTVSVGDELLVGSAEGGFMGLEELTATDGMIVSGLPLEDTSELIPEPPSKLGKREKSGNKEKPGKKGAQEPAPKGSSGSGTVENPAKKGKEGKRKREEDGNNAGVAALQAELAQLKEENLRLKAVTSGAAKKQNQRQNQKQGGKAGEQPADGSEPAPAAADEAAPEAAEGGKLTYAQRKKLRRDAFRAAKKKELRKLRKAAAAQKLAADEIQAGSAAEPSQESTPHLPEVSQQEKEPRAPADVKAWEGYGLHPDIMGALSAMGFSEPTPIQHECLPSAIRDRRDIIGAAQTGSGKTLAFGLPILNVLLDERDVNDVPEPAEHSLHTRSAEGGELRPLRALILAPTRELALQVCDHLQAVAKPCGIWVVPIVGGLAPAKQQRLLRAQPEVVVATPGRLWELMRDGEAHLTNLASLSFLVLDEADRMVQQGHFEELANILEFIPRPRQAQDTEAESEGDDDFDKDSNKEGAYVQPAEKPSKGKGRRHLLQTFVFSATLTLPEGLRKRLRRGGGGASGSISLEGLMDQIPFRAKPKVADLTSERRLADKVTEAYLECTEDDRDERLYYLLAQHPGRTLVFANAISAVRRLAAILRLLQLPVAPLHASMQQRQRLKALDRFRADENAILVATDVAARGLDIPDVKCVVHYQIPAAVDIYVHRCGRTARATAEGLSVALVVSKESARFAALLKALGQPTPPLFPLDPALLPGAHKRVRLATRLDEALRTVSKAAADKSWEQQAAEAAGIELSDEDDEAPRKKAKNVDAKAIQQELAELLVEPLQPRYSRKYFAGNPAAAIAPDAANVDAGEGQTGAVTKAVQLASQLSQARSNAAAERSKKAAKAGKKASLARKVRAGSASAIQEAALKAELAKRQAGKGGGKKGRFVVIPGAAARESKGPNALEALRIRMAAAGMQKI